MENLDFIQWCLDNLNYWTIMFLMAIESSFIPFPSEVVMTPAAYKAAAGELNVVGVVFFATLGALIGAVINYVLAYCLGRPVIFKFVNSKFGHACLLSQAKLEKAEAYFIEHGVSSTLIGRLVPGVRQIISIPAGLAAMKFPVFALFTFVGAGLWNSVLAAIGYGLFYVVPMDQLKNAVQEYKPYLFWCGVLLFVMFVSYLVVSQIKKIKGK